MGGRDIDKGRDVWREREVREGEGERQRERGGQTEREREREREMMGGWIEGGKGRDGEMETGTGERESKIDRIIKQQE